MHCVNSDIIAATNNIQKAINSFKQSTNDWDYLLIKLEQKPCFSQKNKINPLPLHINNVDIDYVQQHKFPGIVLDSPFLTWKSHVNYIKETSLSRINLLKSISHHGGQTVTP